MALSVWKFHRIVFSFCKSLISYIHVVQLNLHHASSARHILNICHKQTSSRHSRPVTSQTWRGLMHLNTNKRLARDDERLFRGSGATGEPAASQRPFSRTTWIRNNVKSSTAISLLKSKETLEWIQASSKCRNECRKWATAFTSNWLPHDVCKSFIRSSSSHDRRSSSMLTIGISECRENLLVPTYALNMSQLLARNISILARDDEMWPYSIATAAPCAATSLQKCWLEETHS